MNSKYFLFLITYTFSTFIHCYGQITNIDTTYIRNTQVGIDAKNISSFSIPFYRTTHIVSPEPILYVDISSPFVEGELPAKNIFRLKPNTTLNEKGNAINPKDTITVTIVTETFITIFKLSFNVKEDDYTTGNQSMAYIITIDPDKAIQLNSYNQLPRKDYDRLALRAMSNKRKVFSVHNKENGMEFWMNNVYVIGELMLFDMGARNRTNVQYDINSVNFKLVDKYSVNAAVSQEIEMKPLYRFNTDENEIIEKKWRNFYILKKFTYPSQKTLKIELTENQISGRPISLSVDYNQILQSKKLID